MTIDQLHLSLSCFDHLGYLGTFCKMQIHPEHSIYHCPSTGYGVNASIRTFRYPNLKEPEAPPAPHDCAAAQTDLPPKPTKMTATPSLTGSWREKVLVLFDPALRDAEDMMLSLPYDDIREKTTILATVLDDRASPELVAAANRPSSRSRASTKAGRNMAHPSMARIAPESGNRGQAPGASSTTSRAGRALCGQNGDPTIIVKSLFVTSSSLPDTHADRP